MEKKKIPKDLRRLRGQSSDFVQIDYASTWERPGNMQLADLEVGRIVFKRQQVCWQNAGRLPSNAYKILSTDTNWYKRRDRVRPVQKEGENGILIVELNNCEGNWVAGFYKPFAEPLENLVTKTNFKTLCQEKVRLYATEREQRYRKAYGIEDSHPDGMGTKMDRFAFLHAYAMRNDSEEAEVITLQKELRTAGLDPGWPIEKRKT